MDARFTEDFGDDFEEHYRELVQRIEDRSRKIGLHLDAAHVGVLEGSGEMLVTCQFRLGDLAFSPRVQDPEQAAYDRQFRDIADDLETSDYDVLRQKYLAGELDLQQITGEDDPKP